MNYNLLNGIVDTIQAPFKFLSFIGNNWLGLVIGLGVAVLISLIILLVTKQMPNAVICILLAIICSVCGLFISSKLNSTISEALPDDKQRGQDLADITGDNWENTNGGFTFEQIQDAQKDDECPALNDMNINYEMRDFGDYVNFLYTNDSTYYNAMFVKTDNGLSYVGLLGASCYIDWHRTPILRTYYLETFGWYQMNSKSSYHGVEVPEWKSYKRNFLGLAGHYNTFVNNFGVELDFSRNNFSWQYKNAYEAKKYTYDQTVDFVGRNSNAFNHFGEIELIGDYKQATQNKMALQYINTYFNHLYKECKDVEIDKSKVVNVTDLTCIPIAEEERENYPVSEEFKKLYPDIDYYGVYRVNTFATIDVRKANKDLDISPSINNVIEKNKDNEKFQVKPTQKQEKEYSIVSVVLKNKSENVSLADIDLKANPITITFVEKLSGESKVVTIDSIDNLSKIQYVGLIKDKTYDYTISSKTLQFEYYYGSFDVKSIDTKVEFGFEYKNGYINAQFGLNIITSLDLGVIDLKKNPVKILLTNTSNSYEILLDDNKYINEKAIKEIKLGKYNYSILSNQLVFVTESGEIEITSENYIIAFNCGVKNMTSFTETPIVTIQNTNNGGSSCDLYLTYISDIKKCEVLIYNSADVLIKTLSRTDSNLKHYLWEDIELTKGETYKFQVKLYRNELTIISCKVVEFTYESGKIMINCVGNVNDYTLEKERKILLVSSENPDIKNPLNEAGFFCLTNGKSNSDILKDINPTNSNIKVYWQIAAIGYRNTSRYYISGVRNNYYDKFEADLWLYHMWNSSNFIQTYEDLDYFITMYVEYTNTNGETVTAISNTVEVKPINNYLCVTVSSAQ